MPPCSPARGSVTPAWRRAITAPCCLLLQCYLHAPRLPFSVPCSLTPALYSLVTLLLRHAQLGSTRGAHWSPGSIALKCAQVAYTIEQSRAAQQSSRAHEPERGAGGVHTQYCHVSRSLYRARPRTTRRGPVGAWRRSLQRGGISGSSSTRSSWLVQARREGEWCSRTGIGAHRARTRLCRRLSAHQRVGAAQVPESSWLAWCGGGLCHNLRPKLCCSWIGRCTCERREVAAWHAFRELFSIFGVFGEDNTRLKTWRDRVSEREVLQIEMWQLRGASAKGAKRGG